MTVNILVFGLTENSGGIESFLYNYIKKISSIDLHFDFISNVEKAAYEKEFQEIGCHFYKIPKKRDSFIQYYKELEKFFQQRASEYDGIWVNICNITSIDYLKMAKKYGISFRIIHSHNSKNMDGKFREMLHLYYRRKIRKVATNFWACSSEAGKWFYNDEILNSSQYQVVKNVIDSEKYCFCPQCRTNIRKELNCEEKFVIGNVGRLHFQKNQTFLLEIFSEVIKKISNVHLLLVGQGTDEEMLRMRTRELGIEKNVSFLGIRKDISGLLSAMDVFVFPSVFEGLGIALLEAQASGLPILASADVIPFEVKVSEMFWFISLEKSAEEWSKKIIEIAKMPVKDRWKGLECVKRSGYDIESEAEKLRNTFMMLGKNTGSLKK